MDILGSYQDTSDRDMLNKRMNFELQHQRSPFDLPGELLRGRKHHRDEQAFLELQRYADFQNVLSKRLCDEIEKDDILSSIDPQLLPKDETFGGQLPGQRYIHPTLRHPSQRPTLSLPVVIPERKVDGKPQGWVRAYAPSLLECGIDQNTFLRFIDMFNETVKGLPALNDSQVSSPIDEEDSLILTQTTSFDLPSRSVDSRPRHPSFIQLANDQLFKPHGLKALVFNVTTDQSLNPSIYEANQISSISTTTPLLLSGLPSAAPLIFLEADIPAPQIESVQRRGRRHQSVTKPVKSSSPNRRSPRTPRRQLVGVMRDMIGGGGPRKAEKGFMDRVRAKEASGNVKPVTPDIPTNANTPYLIIVNNAEEIFPTSVFGQPLGSKREDMHMADPPPVYKEKMVPGNSQLRLRKDYCVPTL